jgi:anti-sigma factor RsiW
MTCEQWQELLSPFIFNDLPPSLRRGMRRHLRACPACAGDLDLYRRTTELARRLPEAPVPADLARRLIEAVAAELRAGGQLPGRAASPHPALPPRPA